MAADSLVVILGGMLDKSSLRADSERTFRRFGERGAFRRPHYTVILSDLDADVDGSHRARMSSD